MLRAYVINVESAKERWKSVVSEFSKYNIVPKRVDAKTKRGALTSEEKETVSTQCLLSCPHTGLAITMSHIDAWKAALHDIKVNADSQILNRGALICEDDVKLQNFHNFESYMNEVPNDYDIVFVGCLFCQKNVSFLPDLALRLMNRKKVSMPVSEHIWKSSYTFGAHAYYVSEQGLEKLVHLFSNHSIYEQIDIMLNDFSKQEKIITYTMTPLLATQESSLRASSQWKKLPNPKLANFILDKFQLDSNVTLAYGLNYPLKRIKNYEITAWTIILFLYGFLWGLFGFTSKWFKVSFALTILIDAILNDDNVEKSLLNSSINLALFYAGFVVGHQGKKVFKH